MTDLTLIFRALDALSEAALAQIQQYFIELPPQTRGHCRRTYRRFASRLEGVPRSRGRRF